MRSCVICGAASSQNCGGCGNVSYCCVSHQRDHWASHKSSCRPLTLESLPGLGKYLAAARDLAPGDLLLDEPVAVLGPPLDARVGVCLGCYYPVHQYRCTSCGAPLCGPTCEDTNHDRKECLLLEESGLGRKLEKNPALYQLITPLRLIKLKASDPAKYKKCMALSSNIEARRTQLCMEVIGERVRLMVEEVKDMELEYTVEKLEEMMARMDTNMSQVLAQGSGVALCGLYPRVALINHSCVQNCRVIIKKDYTMQVLASVRICKGSPIYISYVSPLQTTYTRTINLLREKQFLCRCPRCTDPTELGSYQSAVCCTSCSGYFLPMPPSLSSSSQESLSTISITQDNLPSSLVKENLNSPSAPKDMVEVDWECNKCGLKEASDDATNRELTISKVQTEMRKNSVEELKALLEKFKSRLHPNHALLTVIRKHLSKALGRANGYSYDRLSLQDLTLKKELNLSLLAVYDLVDPGLSRNRGLTLLDLSQTISRISNKKFAREDRDKPEHLEEMCEAWSKLEEANCILRMEDEEALEGRVAKMAMNQLGMVREYVETAGKGKEIKYIVTY